MKNTILFLFSLFTVSLWAQDFNILNQTTFGGDQDDYPSSLIYTHDSCVLVGGSTYSGQTGDKTDTSRGSSDWLIVKYDTEYNLLWQKTIGGKAWDNLSSIIELSDGNYLLGGCSNSNISGDKTIDTVGKCDYWVIKLSSSGNILWQKGYGGSLTDAVNNIIELSDGNIMLLGKSYSDISGDKSENSKGHSDFWLIKTDADGNLLWDKTIGSASYESILTMVKDNQDNMYLACIVESEASGDKTEGSFNDTYDVWMVKVNSDGEIVWDKTIGSNGTDYSPKLFYYHNHIYLSSWSDGDGGLKTSPPIKDNGYGDIWLVKLDTAGQIIWDKTIGGYYDETVSSMLLIDSTHILLVASSYSDISGDKTEDSKKDDNWLIAIDTTGQIIWDKTIVGIESDVPVAAIKSKENQIIVASYSNSGIGGNKTDACRGEDDFWLYTLDITYPYETNILALQKRNTSFSFYPNPADKNIHINYKKQKNPTVNLYDITGKAIRTSIISKNNSSCDLDVHNLPSGVYFLKVGQYSQKLIIQ